MLTRRQTGIALRCSACGNTSLFPVSLFVLGSGRREFRCSCGQHILTVSRKGADVWTQLACFLCDGVHLFRFADKTFWSRDIKSILCPDTGAEIGYIGPLWNLLRVADIRDEIIPKMASLFHDSASGSKIISRLLELDDRGGLRCSKCDNLFEIEVYSEGIEICCEDCGTSLYVPVGDQSPAARNAGAQTTGESPSSGPAPGIVSASTPGDALQRANARQGKTKRVKYRRRHQE